MSEFRRPLDDDRHAYLLRLSVCTSAHGRAPAWRDCPTGRRVDDCRLGPSSDQRISKHQSMTATAQELTSRGVALGREKRLREAIDCFEQALRLDPHFAVAHRNLGYARELLGDLSGALDAYRRAVELNPTA